MKKFSQDNLWLETRMKSTNKNLIDMKKIILILLFIVPSFICFAQKVSYSYDVAGNRVKREIVMNAQAKPISTTSVLNESLSEKTVKIRPNPTSGILCIEIMGYDSHNDNCKVQLFNLSRQCIYSKYVKSQQEILDISSQKNGIYILLITLNGKQLSWKVIKES